MQGPARVGDVHDGLRGVLDAKLATLGMRITWRQTWDDLVLPDDAVAEPGPKGTISLIGRAGQDWAKAGETPAASREPRTRRRVGCMSAPTKTGVSVQNDGQFGLVGAPQDSRSQAAVPRSGPVSRLMPQEPMRIFHP